MIASVLRYCVQVLLSLPGVTPGMVEEMEGVVRGRGSGKEQRGAMKKLLLHSGEGGQLKALLQGKTTRMMKLEDGGDKGERFSILFFFGVDGE